jgi:hypothetical protein
MSSCDVLQTNHSIHVEDLVERLAGHPLYARITGEEPLRRFMASHVYCVWDFQFLLKALQRQLTCVEVPWLPTPDPESRRLVNEIVLDEESDEVPSGGYLSHFELYLWAMEQCQADTRPMRRLLTALRGGAPLEEVLARAPLPPGVSDFVANTVRVIQGGEVHRIAAAFTYGREDVIPVMFEQLVRRLAAQKNDRWSVFLCYLDRHIEHDGDRHGPMSRSLVQRLCGSDGRLWSEAEETARTCLKARIALWDRIAAAA